MPNFPHITGGMKIHHKTFSSDPKVSTGLLMHILEDVLLGHQEPKVWFLRQD
jgi:hypothetical protein